ncbi:VATF ATPase, partial [Atlantisia rogersi]|nr:VATF ATPase [Atlantisia rogersi]
RSFISREDIAIVLISQVLAEQIRHAVEAHVRPLPAVLEIPSKEQPYDPAKDSVLRRARGLFSPDDLR